MQCNIHILYTAPWLFVNITRIVCSLREKKIEENSFKGQSVPTYTVHFVYVVLFYDFYQEAHAMVRAAKVKQAAAEKRFKEANNKVGRKVQLNSSEYKMPGSLVYLFFCFIPVNTQLMYCFNNL